jgi:hypothetical protein
MSAEAVKTEAAQDQFLTPEELVQRYKGTITLRTLINWRYTKEGPAWTKIGRTVLYGLSDVEAWEARRRIGNRK